MVGRRRIQAGRLQGKREVRCPVGCDLPRPHEVPIRALQHLQHVLHHCAGGRKRRWAVCTWPNGEVGRRRALLSSRVTVQLAGLQEGLSLRSQPCAFVHCAVHAEHTGGPINKEARNLSQVACRPKHRRCSRIAHELTAAGV